MELKKKPCNGNGLAKGYGCGKETLYRVYGLGKMCGCYSNWLLNSENGKIKMQKAILKASKTRLEFEEYKRTKQDNNALKRSKNLTKEIVHSYVRERDKYKPCISCGAEWNNDFHCGHHYKSETYETLKYNLDNLHGQCVRCNIFLDSNFDNYALNLPNRIGKERYNALVELAKVDKLHSKVWNLENLKEIRTKVKQLRKELNG